MTQINQMTQMTQIKFNVTEMTCSHCQKHVQKAIESVEGVSRAVVDLAQAQAIVDYDPAKTNVETIKKAVVDAGYGV